MYNLGIELRLLVLFSVFHYGMSSKKVAIIGGGVSGLSTAQQLVKHGIDCTVFDTGKHFAGGRCSSRHVKLGDDIVVVDHSAQYFTAQGHSFSEWCAENGNYIKTWDGPLGSLKTGEAFQPFTDVAPRYVGKQGMRSLSEALSQGVDVKIKTWVSALDRTDDNRWRLREHGKVLGTYDVVVIAHNGKCADRLLGSAGSPRIHDLLKVNFGPTLPAGLQTMRKMHLSSLFVLSIIVSSPVQVPFEGAYVQDSKQCLSWVCNTSAKIGAARDKYESWTLVSTRSYASSNKVPQEAIPADKEYQVKSEMLAAFAELIGAPDSALQVTASKLQLWGAAVPLNRHSASFVLDGKEKIGIAGDWFTSSAAKSPGIESAWASGRLLADELAKGLSSTDGVLADVGFKVDECFEACDGAHPLGDVTGFASIVQRASQRGPPLTPGQGAPVGVPSSNPTFKKKRY